MHSRPPQPTTPFPNALRKAFTHWIPPVPLVLAQLSFALSWVLLWLYGASRQTGPTFLALAWVHAIALGWITLVALAVLIHVIPAFTNVEWRIEPLARASVTVFALGVALLIAGFWIENAAVLEIAGAIVALSLTAYAIAALATLVQTATADAMERAIGRALALTLVLFFAAAALGVAFTFALNGRAPATLLVRAPSSHAVLAIAGWITLLISGVSARTMRPMSGVRSRWPRMHILSASALWIGTLVAAGALWVGNGPFSTLGVWLITIGVAVYAYDIVDIVARATVPHRPPQVLMLAAVLFAIAACLCAVFSLFTAPLAPAAVVAALLGWAGCAVLAHLHHIGVRVVITFIRGDEDETRPWSVLDARLTWTTAIAYLAAAVLATLGAALASGSLFQLAAVLGAIAWIALASNVTAIPRRLAALPYELRL